MAETVISYRLDLIVRLIDTTTGKTIPEKNIRFTVADKPLRLIDKGDAGYILLNHGREDFSFKVSAYGYETAQIPVEYKKINQSAPAIEAYLLPLDTQTVGSNVASIQGVLPGIEAIEAVSLATAHTNVKEFDERRRILTVSNPHKLELQDIHYGILNREKNQYEHVMVVKNVSENAVKIDRVVTLSQGEGSSLARVVFGRIGPDGAYLLRVRKDSQNTQYLVRYVVNGAERFYVADFAQQQDGVLV